MPITGHHSINNEFHSANKKIYSKQDVDDSSEAIQEFLDSGGNTKHSEYLKFKALTNELQYALYKKIKGSSAPGIDGFTVNWLKKFWDSLKLLPQYWNLTTVLTRTSTR